MSHRRSGLCLRFPRASTRNPHRPQFLHSAARFWYCGSPRSDGQLCPAKREGSWLGRMIAAEPALPAILESEWPGGNFQKTRLRDWLPGLAASSPFCSSEQKKGCWPPQSCESSSRDGDLTAGLRRNGTRLGGRCWAEAFIAPPPAVTMAGQEHTNNAVRGGWPRTAF